MDDRFKSKHESIKAYFDANITRILLNSGQPTNEKILELGREIVALKLIESRHHDLIASLKAQVDAGEMHLAHQKEVSAHLVQRLKEAGLKFQGLE